MVGFYVPTPQVLRESGADAPKRTQSKTNGRQCLSRKGRRQQQPQTQKGNSVQKPINRHFPTDCPPTLPRDDI